MEFHVSDNFDIFDVCFGRDHVIFSRVFYNKAAIQILKLEMVSNERNVNSTCF